ncbi:MAG TPA: HAMP domain-containing sensor histidine kinase [bacterium]|nr:HAMP domain-containing sensor histidine kinase [bacterium]
MPLLEEKVRVDRLVWFIHLRWVAIFGGLLILLVSPWVTTLSVPYGLLMLCLGFLGLLNVTYLVYWEKVQAAIHSPKSLAERAGNLMHVQMGGDFLVLTVMLYLGGGAGNPLVLFYLFHVAIAVLVFPLGESIFYVPLAIVLPWLLSVLPSFGVQPLGFAIGAGALDSLEQKAFLCAYSASVVGIWFFLSRLSLDIRRQQALLVDQARQLREAKEGLEQLDQFKNQFLSQVAEHLQGPCGEMAGHLEKMEKEVPAAWPGGGHAVRETRRHLESFRTTVEDLLWLSRMDVKDFPLRKESLEAYAVALRHIQALESQARVKGIEFQLHGSDQTRLWADREGFGRVLDNLLSNAVKYSPKGGGTVTVELKVQPDWLVLSVQDEGIGIPADQKKKIFSGFFRASNAQARDKFGTGLGLAIVQRILAWHGGKVVLDSHLKKGTRIETWWPLPPALKGGMEFVPEIR